MPQLQDLSLAYLDITDEGLAALTDLLWLERLNLQHTAVSNDAIVSLVNHKSATLQQLNVSNTVINDRALEEFPDATQLNSLRLKDTGISNQGCKSFERFEWLTDLNLDLTAVGDDGCRHLAECQRLTRLELFRTKITDASLVWLSDLPLEHLDARYTALTDVGMPTVADLKALNSLDIAGTPVTNRGLRFWAAASSLEKLYLESTQVSEDGVEHLLHLQLKSLSLNYGVTDRCLETLSKIETLQNLAMWNTKVTSWEPLTKLQGLEVLLLDDSSSDLSPLQDLRQLRCLLLAEAACPTEVSRLRSHLPNCFIRVFSSYHRAVDQFRRLVHFG